MPPRASQSLLVVVAAAAALAMTGCGARSSPRLARADSAPLVALSHRIAREGACAQARDIRALRVRTQALVEAERVPRALEPALLGGVRALGTRIPPCLPTVPTIAVAPPPSTHHPHGGGKHGHGHKEGGD